jgi:hypothetical protein
MKKALPASISLSDLESAINYWRAKNPSVGEECRLCAEASALATPYALLILGRQQTVVVESLSEKAQGALVAWQADMQKI